MEETVAIVAQIGQRAFQEVPERFQRFPAGGKHRRRELMTPEIRNSFTSTSKFGSTIPIRLTFASDKGKRSPRVSPCATGCYALRL